MDKKAELLLRLVDGVTGPARGIKAELASINAIAGGFGKGLSGASLALDRAILPLASSQAAARGVAAYGAELAALSAIKLPRAGALSSGLDTDAMTRAMQADAEVMKGLSPGVLGLLPAPAILGPFAGGLAAREVVTAAADFESALTGIQKKAGATAAETAKLGEEIKALATSGDLAVSIAEIAAAYERGAAGGLPLAELREFARLSSMASDAFEMSAVDASNAAAGFSKILKIPMDGMERYFDLINALGDAGISNERDIIEFVDRVGSSLKQFGLKNEEIAAYGASLLNLKVPAEVAANAMKSFTTRIAAPSTMDKAGQAWLERLTGGIDQFQHKIREDANGALLELLDAIEQLDDVTKTEALARLAGGNYNDNIATLVDNLEEVRRNLRLAAGTDWFGSLGKSYALKLDDFWSRWQLVKNALGKLTIDTGTMGMPAFKATLEAAIALVGEIDEGLGRFRAEVNLDELQSAMDSVQELGGAIGELMSMGGEGSAIETFFERLASTANMVSGAIEAGKDALQAVGLVDQDDDTAEQRAARRSAVLDDYEKFNPYLGKISKAVREWWNRDPEEERARFDAGRQKWMDDYERSGSRYQDAAPVRSPPAERGPRRPPARLTAAQAYAISGTGEIGNLGKATGEIPPPVARPKRSVPIPTARPDFTAIITEVDAVGRRISEAFAVTAAPTLAEPVRLEGEQAAVLADVAGARIASAFAVTARPIVDVSSIVSAAGKVAALAAALRALPGAAVGGPGLGNIPAAASPGSAIGAMIPKKAGGGAIRRGLYEVGERGRELVSFGSNGYVTPNHRLGGERGGDVHHYHITGSNGEEIARAIEKKWNRRLNRSSQIAINR